VPDFEYRKSSYSDEKAECVEIATNIPTSVAIRDSKAPSGPHIQVCAAAWTRFQVAVADGGLRALA
jgi:hypothetical protein